MEDTRAPDEADKAERQRLRSRLVDLLNSYSSEANHIGHAFAGRHRLHGPDLHALLAVMHAERAGEPLTPGRLGETMGLSSGATTAMIDRLERGGHLRRSRESSDRRVVHLRYAEAGMALAAAFFQPLAPRTDAVMARFDTEELQVVERFVRGMVEALLAYRDELRAE
ncbi:MarR family transcriptional regulator [Actinoplanes sp. SE50]|uniref:MarR family transcriptional regulator n=1 Tax=unclassified Actinoplanes TaxID=2626549 RepID=UPI00023EBD06|nr:MULTISPECIES: MarR family transcriptional regulator [unclassified Actinoplanes]AEV83447.1 Organic hydroperoxide resistance transcriptional regulator [Actinoplanes sp. SE50/110]ATO81840.1 MarR family transcriptional regulator [Actinoplanes sp. SE50]SLL99248.1 MarR family transcriptional regulator [Actinoplanes sp. SE50/110]